MQDQGNDQMVVLSPEAANEIKQLRLAEVEASEKRRELSRDLRKDIRKIENKIKNLNIAGVPILIPLVINGLFSSYGIIFLLVVIPASSNLFSAIFPVIPLSDKSISIK